jgi:glycosyltransferase involved in cell wall biosynthesis
MAMKILALDLGADWRGGQKQTALLLPRLAARGHTVRLLAREGAPLLKHLTAAPAPRLEVAPVPHGSEAAPPVLMRVAREARAFQADIVYAADARGHGAAVWSRAAATAPVVVHRRVMFPPGANPLSRLKYAAVRRYLAISAAVAGALEAAGIDGARIAVVPDGLPPDAFVSHPPPQAPPFRLVHAGAFDGQKGQEVAVDVVARLTAQGLDVHALFLGEGPALGDVEAAARRTGVLPRCAFAGRVDDVAARLSTSHILLLPTRSEGGGMVLAEAMAAGCATLAHDVGGTREMTRDGTAGRLLPSLDPAVWAAAVSELLGDGTARAALIAAGREVAASRTIEVTVDRVEEELRRTLA